MDSIYQFIDILYNALTNIWDITLDNVYSKRGMQEFSPRGEGIQEYEFVLQKKALQYTKTLLSNPIIIKNTFDVALQKMEKYWNYISPIFLEKENVDWVGDARRNRCIKILYYGTLDNIAVQCLSYATFKQKVCLAAFHGLSVEIISERLERHSLCSKSVFQEKIVQYLQIYGGRGKDILDYDGAIIYLQRLQGGGYLDNNFAWLRNGTNRTYAVAAVAAKEIGLCVGIHNDNFGKAFERLWDRPAKLICDAYTSALDAKKKNKYEAMLKILFGVDTDQKLTIKEMTRRQNRVKEAMARLK